MMIPDHVKADIIAKKTRLKLAEETLKHEFYGIDEVITNILTAFEQWYLFPEYTTKPVIINLWGLTGTGKTSLIRRLVQILELDELYFHMDMAEYNGSYRSSIQSMLTGDLEFLHNKPCILCLDEIQNARSIDSTGKEGDQNGMRALWDLLDTGEIKYIKNYSREIERMLEVMDVLKASNHANIKLANGQFNRPEDVLTLIEKYTNSHRRYFSEDILTDIGELLQIDEYDDLFKSEFKYSIDLIEHIKTLSLTELIEFYEHTLKNFNCTKEVNLRKSLIFIVGNLDEAYSFCSDVDPDKDPDMFHEISKRINITTIKAALQRRFRIEQIARMGNNHVIYPALNSSAYRSLIDSELRKAGKKFHDIFAVDIEFCDSVKEIIFKESVFPLQGARPVITSVSLMIESYFSKITYDILVNTLDAERIVWKYISGKYKIEVWRKSKCLRVFEYEVVINLEKLRNSSSMNQRSYIAVHECGHAIVGALTTGMLPSKITCVSADSSHGGKTSFEVPEEDIFTRNMIYDKIAIALGGYLAEELVFGPGNTGTGSVSDIEIATNEAVASIKNFGMGRDLATICNAHMENNETIVSTEIHEAEALAIIKECQGRAKNILTENYTLLVEMAKELALNKSLSKAEVGALIAKYAADSRTREMHFISKDEYFNFEQLLFGEPEGNIIKHREVV